MVLIFDDYTGDIVDTSLWKRRLYPTKKTKKKSDKKKEIALKANEKKKGNKGL